MVMSIFGWGKKTKPWDKQKALEEKQEMLTEEQIIETINAIIKPRDKALISLLYLTSARIGEVVRNDYHPERSGITAERITEEWYEGRPFLLIKLRNQKAKTPAKKWKIIPINMRDPVDGQLVNNILDLTKHLEPIDPLFNIGTRMARRVVERHMGFNPHWLRHTRLTHLTHRRKYTDHELMQVAGWTDSRMSSTYVQTRWQNVADKEMRE